MLAGDPGDIGHQRSTSRGEVDRVEPPIARVAAAFDETTLFKPVDQGHQPRRRSVELVGKGLLAAPGLLGDRTQQPGLRWCEIKRGDALGECLRGVGAKLGKQECGSGNGQRVGLFGVGHDQNRTT